MKLSLSAFGGWPTVGNVSFTSSPGTARKRSSPSALRIAGHGDAQHHAGVLLLGRIEHVLFGLVVGKRVGVGERIGRRSAGAAAARRSALSRLSLCRFAAETVCIRAISRRCSQPASAICVPLGRFGPALMVADVVAALAQLETHRLAVLRVLQDTCRNRSRCSASSRRCRSIAPAA